MKKDVIYIDVEDDITSIIGKIKSSKYDDVFLVPPKRIGILQSAVNLKLIHRATKQSKKTVALVTNNTSLIALSAAAKIPVAKNIQSDSELIVPAQSDAEQGEEIIDGATLPIGDHEAHGVPVTKSEKRGEAMAAALSSSSKSNLGKKPAKKKKSNVPNFDIFRKKLIIFILLGIALIAFGIWAFFFAGRATVMIDARTEGESINIPVSIRTGVKTNVEQNQIVAEEKTETEEKSEKVSATGKKDVGQKANGVVQFSTDSIAVAQNGVTIPAGTELQSSSGLTFITDETVEITLLDSQGSSSVTADEKGSKYNAASGSVSGGPDGVTAEFSDATSGGVSKIVKIVTASDVQRAKEQIVDEEDTSDIEKELIKSFGDDAISLDESFKVDYDDVVSSPEIGEEADEVSVSTTATYSAYAVNRESLNSFIDGYMKDLLDGIDDQQVYENGSDKATFQDVIAVKNGADAILVATAQVGPKIDENQVKEDIIGLKDAEVREQLQIIQGINDVNIDFFPFWVSTVPKDTDKITIEFKIDDGN